MKDMRTPLSRVRGLGSAKTGTRDFWIQRLTAAANVPLALFLITSLVALMGADYATVRSYLVHKEGPKVALLALNNFFSAVVAIAGVYSVLKIGIQS